MSALVTEGLDVSDGPTLDGVVTMINSSGWPQHRVARPVSAECIGLVCRCDHRRCQYQRSQPARSALDESVTSLSPSGSRECPVPGSSTTTPSGPHEPALWSDNRSSAAARGRSIRSTRQPDWDQDRARRRSPLRRQVGRRRRCRDCIWRRWQNRAIRQQNGADEPHYDFSWSHLWSHSRRFSGIAAGCRASA